MAAINPPDADYEVAELDPALLSRFTQIQVVSDRDEWLAWARAHGIQSAVLRYVESDRTIFNQPQSNPRAWKYVSDLVKAAPNIKASKETLRTGIVGLVGEERAAAFMQSLADHEKPLTAKDIFNAYPSHRPHLK